MSSSRNLITTLDLSDVRVVEAAIRNRCRIYIYSEYGFKTGFLVGIGPDTLFLANVEQENGRWRESLRVVPSRIALVGIRQFCLAALIAEVNAMEARVELLEHLRMLGTVS